MYSKRRLLTTATILTILIVGAVVASYHEFGIKQGLVAQPKVAIKGIVTHTTTKPSEAPVVQASYVSTAGPTEPVYIDLPTIGIGGYIEKMGIDQNNDIAAPTNINLAGWYVDSISPGQAGLSIIDGHVDGVHGAGIFYKLDKLAVSDGFTIRLGNSTVEHFRVVSVSTINNQDAAAALFSHDPNIKSQLNLITCGGEFNQQTQSYEQRTIIVSALSN
jgi:LPXTG-site transpeptidase (sortase) family protein